MTITQEIRAGATALGLNLSGAQVDHLVAYLELIGKWNQVYNLTAIRDPDKLVTYHLLDSLAVLPHLPATNLLDVGSGPGLPGIPLAIARPDLRVALLDSNHKKGSFLRQAKLELGLDNVEVIIERVETYHPRDKFGAAISRAFSDLATFVQAAQSLISPDGVLLAMKGVYPHEELEQLPSSMILEKVIRLSVPGLDAERHLVILRGAGAVERAP